ncbi:MAG: hypothetical protein K0V04_21300, partial [Deltaproteobacteria bacterium]|nr:hypothetical protein [Deltaproteobacteria bacterium]
EEGYWSAYVSIENQDIPHLWKTSDLDYAVISIEVTIPTRNGPVVRTVPLFTLDHGVPQAETGVDLLKKIPLTSEAREQISFKLEVKYLKNKAALDTSRAILGRITDLAKPYLGNYPVASQIIETSLGLIDDAVASKEGAVSSMVTVVDADRVRQKALASSTHSSLQAFFLLPIELSYYRGRGQDGQHDQCRDKQSVESCGVKSWVNKQIGPGNVIVECPEFPGRLCVAPKSYVDPPGRDVGREKKRLQQDIETTAAGLMGPGQPTALDPDASSLTILLNEIIQDEELDITIRDIDPPTIDVLQRLADHTDSYRTSNIEPCEQQFVDTRDPPPVGRRTLEDCEEAVYAYEDLRGHLVDLAFEAAIETNQIVANQRKAEAHDSERRYRPDRLDSLVYITIRFKRFEDVYDPQALIAGSHSDCRAITEEAIESTQEYFGANIDFFRAQDADKIRRMLRSARDYLLIKSLVAKGSHIEAARSLGDMQLLLPDPMNHSLEHRLDAHVFSIHRCFDKLRRRPPLRQLARLWTLYLRPGQGLPRTVPRGIVYGEAESTSLDPRSSSARRVDDLVASLEDFARVIGDSPPKLDPHGIGDEFTPALGEKSKDLAIAELLFEEATQLMADQRELASAVTDCKSAVEVRDSFGATCRSCLATLRSKCDGDGQDAEKAIMLDHIRAAKSANRRFLMWR